MGRFFYRDDRARIGCGEERRAGLGGGTVYAPFLNHFLMQGANLVRACFLAQKGEHAVQQACASRKNQRPAKPGSRCHMLKIALSNG